MNKSFGQEVPEAADHTVFTKRSAIRLPLNLAEWIPRETLAQWVKEAVEHLDPSQPEVRAFFAEPPEATTPLSLAALSVLVFGYATQVFTSAEILRGCQTDLVFHGLCGDGLPSADGFDRCRRKHRPLLEWVLSQILVRAVNEKYHRLGKLPPGLQWSLVGRASDRLDAAHLLDSFEECEQ